MINLLRVDGFKSLNNFELEFREGLNVLIGPNGAGKSNICQALGLLSALAKGDLTEYMLALGGVDAVFSSCRGMSSSSPAQIALRCTGQKTQPIEGESSLILRYSYDVILHRSREGIEVDSENLRIRRQTAQGTWRTILKCDRVGLNATLEVRNPDLLGPVYWDTLARSSVSRLTLQNQTSSLMLNLEAFLAAYAVRADLRDLRALHVDPYLARRSTDILEPRQMLPDGRRLAGAIHAMAEPSNETIDALNNILIEALPELRSVEPTLTSDGLLRTFKVNYENGLECVAHSLPDGVIKLIAVIVGILQAYRNSLVIEEPENYLHPWVSQWLIGFVRETFSEGNCILTTHSETILNRISPTEIVIVVNLDGATQADRLRDSRGVADAIQASGFGCGYHYVSGALGGTPD